MQIHGIDAKDNEIISLLAKNARMSYSDIGALVGLSRTAVKNRVTALEARGIICGYRAVIDPQKSPEMMAFVVNVETTPECFETAKEALANTQEVVTLVQTTGNCHLLAVCVAKDVPTMRTFVNRIYKTYSGIRSVSAHSVLDIVKGSILPE